MSEGLLRSSDVKLALSYIATVAGIDRRLKLYGQKGEAVILVGVKQNVKHLRGCTRQISRLKRKSVDLAILTFDKHRPRFAGQYAGMAQLAAHLICNQTVLSSSLGVSSIIKPLFKEWYKC